MCIRDRPKTGELQWTGCASDWGMAMERVCFRLGITMERVSLRLGNYNGEGVLQTGEL